MSDENHIEPVEDGAIQALIEAFERQIGPDGPSLADAAHGTDPADETLTRLYTEAFGLLPFALEPLAPSPAVRARLLAMASGGEAPAVERRVAAAPLPPVRPLAAAPAAVVAPSAPARQVHRAPRWPLALAAMLALALLGVSAKMVQNERWHGRLHAADYAQISVLRKELTDEHARLLELAAARGGDERLRAKMGDLEKTVSLVTSPTVEMSPLRPTGDVALARQANGRIYIAEDHQHWYLSVQNLEPSGSGHQYQLWFFGDQGPVSGGHFTAAPGEAVSLSSEHMPRGTKAILITLEPAAGSAAPSGPVAMRAAPPVKIS